MRKHLLLVGIVMLTANGPLPVGAADEHSEHHSGQANVGASHKGHGVVNSVNAAAGRVNVTHDPIESLQWPKMKMNFKVQDPAMLMDLKAGTEVDFELQKSGDEYEISKIAPSN